MLPLHVCNGSREYSCSLFTVGFAVVFTQVAKVLGFPPKLSDTLLKLTDTKQMTEC